MYLLRKGYWLVLIIGIMTAISVGYQGTWTVCPEGSPRCDFASIQAALSAARPGDTIVVKPGIYKENPVITTSHVTLRGEDPRAVRLQADLPIHALEIQAVGVIVEGLTITRAGRGESAASFAGIYVVGAGAILRRNILQDNNIGIKVVNAIREPQVQILENTFTSTDKDIEAGGRTLIQGNKLDGELGVDTGGYAEIRENQGTILRINGLALVEGNRFRQVKVFSQSVGVEEGTTTILRSNQIIGTGQRSEESGAFELGLEIKTSAPVLVEENLFSRQGASAIFIDEPIIAEIILRRNVITNNGNGLWLLAEGEGRNSHVVRLEGNTIERNSLWAVQLSALDTSTSVELVNNLVRLNQGGGIMIGAAGRYRVESNRIIDNDDWGVVVLIPPCVQEDLGLRPQVTGSGNEIANNGKRLKPEEKQVGDGEGNVCPKELLSLKK